jgi:CDP-paratose 2-epimerase
MKLLITGGCGFVGSNLAGNAINQGFELAIIDNLYRTGSEQNLKWLKEQGNFKFYKQDTKDFDGLSKAIKDFKPEAVFHLAGQAAMTASIENPRLDFETNALGSFNLLESIRLFCSESALFYSSTNKVYGDLEDFTYTEKDTRYICEEYPNGFDESLPLDFRSPYGCSKGCADQYILDYSRIFKLKTVVFRHSAMYGGRQFATYGQGWVGWFCQKAVEEKKGLLKEPFTVSGNGKQVRDVLYASDIVNVYFAALKNIDKARGQIFNIGAGVENSLSLLELFSLLRQELGIEIKYKQIPWRESDQKVFIADSSKAKKVLGWAPQINCKNGVKKMVDWTMDLVK